MNKKINQAVVRAARYGFNIPETVFWLSMHKDRVVKKEFDSFIVWAKDNDEFYYWLRARLNSDYKNAKGGSI